MGPVAHAEGRAEAVLRVMLRVALPSTFNSNSRWVPLPPLRVTRADGFELQGYYRGADGKFKYKAGCESDRCEFCA